MVEFETIINPSQDIFEQIVYWTGETEQWGFQLNDYNFWSTQFDQFWLFTTIEKGTNNLVASVSLARWDGEDGPLYSLGMYYCSQKYRGQGFGAKLFKQAMDIVGDNNATLTGVVKMSAKYASVHGFDKMPPFWHLSANIKSGNIVIPTDVSTDYVSKKWVDVDYEHLTTYDNTICTRNRRKIMTAWFNLKDTFTQVVVDKDGKIVGYGTIRLISKNRMAAAPFYADNLNAAEVLLAGLLSAVPNYKQYDNIGFLYPEINTDAAKLCERFSTEYTAVPFIKCQFTKKFIDVPDKKVYGLCDCAHQFV